MLDVLNKSLDVIKTSTDIAISLENQGLQGGKRKTKESTRENNKCFYAAKHMKETEEEKETLDASTSKSLDIKQVMTIVWFIWCLSLSAISVYFKVAESEPAGESVATIQSENSGVQGRSSTKETWPGKTQPQKPRHHRYDNIQINGDVYIVNCG